MVIPVVMLTSVPSSATRQRRQALLHYDHARLHVNKVEGLVTSQSRVIDAIIDQLITDRFMVTVLAPRVSM